MKFFTTSKKIGKLIRDMQAGESEILELTVGTSFAEAQRCVKSYALRSKVKIDNEGFKAISYDDKVIKFLKITKK